MALNTLAQFARFPGASAVGECRACPTPPDGSLLVSAVACRAVGLVFALAMASCTSIITPPTIPPAQPPSSGLIASGSFARPAVAVAQDGTIYVAAEGPGMASIHRYTFDGGKWTGGEIVRASEQTALRCYVPSVVPSGIVSWRWGKKEGGVLHGPGIYANGKTLYPGLTHGAARLAEHNGTVYLMAKDGAFAELDAQGNAVRFGSYPAGLTGEKFAFTIDASGTWQTAHNGSSMQASAVCIGGKRQTWASHDAYPEQGNDLCYVDICAANGKTYISANYSGETRVQVMDAGKPRYSVDALPSLGKGSLEQRCPPRLVAGPAGVVAIWRAGKAVVAVNVEKCLAGTAKPAQVATGEFPAAAAGPDGTIHLVYVSTGLQHKEIKP